MLPIAFGLADRPLFGIFHARPSGTPPGLGVVLCAPFGQEAIRAHRFQRVLAERLVRAGCDVLRFDYHGTGDSPGEDEDGDLELWSSDLLAAHEELRARAGVTRVGWHGMRLGGEMVRRAAHEQPAGLERIALWDPVIDGREYLEFLRKRHVETLVAAFSLRQKPFPPELAARDPQAYRDEAIGFRLSPRLRQQLQDLSAASWKLPDVETFVVFDEKDVAAARACASQGERVKTFKVSHGTDWTTDSAGNTSLVPAPALMLFVEKVWRVS
jgi:pimeloyl-ACP methyl ester carboxylesterase